MSKLNVQLYKEGDPEIVTVSRPKDSKHTRISSPTPMSALRNWLSIDKQEPPGGSRKVNIKPAQFKGFLEPVATPDYARPILRLTVVGLVLRIPQTDMHPQRAG